MQGGRGLKEELQAPDSAELMMGQACNVASHISGPLQDHR